MTFTDDQDKALLTARSLIELGYEIELVLRNDLIPEELREFVREELERERTFPLVNARTITGNTHRVDWLSGVDRSGWYYWPTLRNHLMISMGREPESLRSLDDSSDRVLQQIADPTEGQFDIRGMVLGFVQSGKTANYTALIAKAADSGYKLFIVLSGMDNGLRKQTNLRLKQEVVGFPESRSDSVRLPPLGSRWHEFTRDDFNGDFQPGFANHAALQGSQPVLLVIKKNGPVLRRLHRWLDSAPEDVFRNLPLLMVDDEADQASIDTRGSHQTDSEISQDDYEPPSVINGLVRGLLQKFNRRAYVAYTATPFANILIPHDTVDPTVGNDLYPRDFIIDLPKPLGYFGAEDIFGKLDPESGGTIGGLDVLNDVSDADMQVLRHGEIPDSLEQAIIDFVLTGSALTTRSRVDCPATMLIHTSHRISDQSALRILVATRFSDLRDEWRYQRQDGIRDRLQLRWNEEFRSLTLADYPERDLTFEQIESKVNRFFEEVQVKEINSATGEVLDYIREPNLKAIAIGGNRLARGLTLDGILISYFVRQSPNYDTLMQMGRWFGFRQGHEDLLRIWTPAILTQWFSDLAHVESRLREDIRIYDDLGLTPYQVGMRIWQHPAMQVTSRIKRRFANNIQVSSSYSLQLEQTFKFPLDDLDELSEQEDANLICVQNLVTALGDNDTELSDEKGPVWSGVSSDHILAFVSEFRQSPEHQSVSMPLVHAYIEKLIEVGELMRWTVAVRGRAELNRELGQADWSLPTGTVNQISRSRLLRTDSLGVITDPPDEAVGLNTHFTGKQARAERSHEEGLLILYPISRRSGQALINRSNRTGLYDDPSCSLARDLVGVAISFPTSATQVAVEGYLVGTQEWRTE